MSRPSIANTVAITGLFTALAVLLQAAPVYLGTAGMILRPLATLPVLLAAMRSTRCGLMCWCAATLLLLIISSQEAAIFLCATGLLGLVTGLTQRFRFIASWASAAAALFVGMLALAYVAGVDMMGLAFLQPRYLSYFLMMTVSILYAGLWQVPIRFIIKK